MEENEILNTRMELNFNKIVIKTFNYLLAAYDFKIVSEKETFVRYESDKIFLNIYHGRSSYEVGIEIGLKSSKENMNEAYYITELMTIDEDKKNDRFRLPIADTAEKVEKSVLLLSSLLDQYGQKALVGDSETFKRLQINRAKGNLRFIHDIKLNNTREIAYNAFKQKLFHKAVEAYESILEDLTPSEKKKMEYAKNRVKK